MKKKKLLYAILCALGGGFTGFFANHLTVWYRCNIWFRCDFNGLFNY